MSPASRRSALVTTCLLALACDRGFRVLDPPPPIELPSVPLSLAYAQPSAVYLRGVVIAANQPSTTGANPTGYSASVPLPAGLALDPVTGVISGTPSQVTAQVTITVTASNGKGSVSTSVTIRVDDVAPSMPSLAQAGQTLAPGAAVVLELGRVMSPIVLSAGGGLATGYRVSPALPDGLGFDTRTGTLLGSPTTLLDPTAFTLTVTNDFGEASTTLTIQITDVAPVLTFSSNDYRLVVGEVLSTGQPINAGGQIVHCVATTMFPDPGWLVDDATCAVTGVAQTVSQGTYALRVDYRAGASPALLASTTVNLTVEVNAALVVSPLSTTVTAGGGRVVPLTATGGVPPYAFTVDAGPGSADLLSGVVSLSKTPGLVSVRVTDSAQRVAHATVRAVSHIVDGTVQAIEPDPPNDALYLGGWFSALYPHHAPNLLAIDKTKGDPLLPFDVQDGFDGAVNAAVLAGGSLFVIGGFSRYRDLAARGIAKIDPATGALDQTFTQALGFSPAAATLVSATASDVFVYVPGALATVTYRAAPITSNIVRLDASTGALAPLCVGCVAGGSINTMLAVGNQLILGGAGISFASALDNLIAVDLLGHGTGLAANGQVKAIAALGADIVVSGAFSTIGLTSVSSLARLNPSTGVVTPWSTPTSFDLPPDGLSVQGSQIYALGAFTTPTKQVARIDAGTGQAGAFASGPSGFSFAGGTPQLKTIVAMPEGIAVGGVFDGYNGQALQNVALLTPAGTAVNGFGAARMAHDWAGNGSAGSVTTLVDGGDRMFVGGVFRFYGGVPAQNLARLRDSTGAVDVTFTKASGPTAVSGAFAPVRSLHAAGGPSGGSVFVGGLFDHVGVTACSAFAKLSSSSAVDPAFPCPMVTLIGGTGNVQAIAQNGNDVFIGGSFDHVGATPMQNIAGLFAASGTLDSSVIVTGSTNGFDQPVTSIVIIPAQSMIVGGQFAAYRNVTNSPCISALSLVNGNRLGTFAANLVSAALALAYGVDGGTGLGYVLPVGDFTSADGSACNGVALLGATLGNIAPGTLCQGIGFAVADANEQLNAAALDPSTHQAFIGGRGLIYRGTQYNAFIAVDSGTGAVRTSFADVASPIGPPVSLVNALVLSADGLWIGGSFSRFGGDVAGSAVLIDPLSGQLMR